MCMKSWDTCYAGFTEKLSPSLHPNCTCVDLIVQSTMNLLTSIALEAVMRLLTRMYTGTPAESLCGAGLLAGFHL